jgi:hypothetical protein
MSTPRRRLCKNECVVSEMLMGQTSAKPTRLIELVYGNCVHSKYVVGQTVPCPVCDCTVYKENGGWFGCHRENADRPVIVAYMHMSCRDWFTGLWLRTRHHLLNQHARVMLMISIMVHKDIARYIISIYSFFTSILMRHEIFACMYNDSLFFCGKN